MKHKVKSNKKLSGLLSPVRPSLSSRGLLLHLNAIKTIDLRTGQQKRTKTTKGSKETKPNSIWKTLIEEFCNGTTLHGLNRITDPSLSPFERWFWIGLLSLAIFGVVFSCKQIQERFETKRIMTYVDNIQYPYSSVPFPSVTVCDSSRVHWLRALALEDSDFVKPVNKTKDLTLALLSRLAFTTFGDFDYFDQMRLEGFNLTSISSLNISQLLLKTMRPCEEMFMGECWWRNSELDCCKIFELQRSEVGFCYSFNSDTSDESWNVSVGWQNGEEGHWHEPNTSIARPRRSAGHGPWSGLKFTVATMPESEMPPNKNSTKPGILVMVNDPTTVPFNGYKTIGAGYQADITLWGHSVQALPRLRNVAVKTRKCLFLDEHYGIPRGYYRLKNCLAACMQNHAIRYCNCSPDFIFHPQLRGGNPIRPCNAPDFLCLSKFNDILTYEVPESSKEFFPTEQHSGMECQCYNDCETQQHIWSLSTTQFINFSNKIEVDVYYRESTLTLYLTDVLFDWLEITVSFGGIAGLYLGASLLSGAELFYYFTIRLFRLWLKRENKTPVQPVLPPYIN